MPFTISDQFEENPDIVLLFHGLMAVWEDPKEKQLNFGCHGSADKPHELEIQIGTYMNDKFVVESVPELSQPGTNFEFSVEGDSNPSVGVYRPAENANRGMERDFAQAIDMEKLHGADIWKESPEFNHLITVKKGILYTKEYTESTFDLHNDRRFEFSDKNVASELGINLLLTEEQTGILKFGDNIFRFRKGEKTPYVIRFSNECNYDWNPKGTETERNDFYLNYDNLIDTNKIERKYGLYLKTQGDDLIPTYGPRSTEKTGKKMFISRDAPCTAQGYPPRT